MWAGHVARMGEGRGVYRVLVGRPEGKRPLRSEDLDVGGGITLNLTLGRSGSIRKDIFDKLSDNQRFK
jgi:hypothetical protein